MASGTRSATSARRRLDREGIRLPPPTPRQVDSPSDNANSEEEAPPFDNHFGTEELRIKLELARIRADEMRIRYEMQKHKEEAEI